MEQDDSGLEFVGRDLQVGGIPAETVMTFRLDQPWRLVQ